MDLANHEIAVLGRFIKGKVIENETEEAILEQYRKIGWVRMGMQLEKEDNKVKVIPTAALTPLGKQFVERARIRRSGLRRLVYKLINLPA